MILTLGKCFELTWLVLCWDWTKNLIRRSPSLSLSLANLSVLHMCEYVVRKYFSLFLFRCKRNIIHPRSFSVWYEKFLVCHRRQCRYILVHTYYRYGECKRTQLRKRERETERNICGKISSIETFPIYTQRKIVLIYLLSRNFYGFFSLRHSLWLAP